jgi:hypothetical protein
VEEAQRAMQILGEDPPLNSLIEPMRITPTDTSNREEELNGSETIPPKGTTDQENPKLMSPQAIFLVTTAPQRRTTR